MLATESLLEGVSGHIGVVAASVDTSARLRDVLYSGGESDLPGDVIDSLRTPELPPTEWRMYDHCAAVTRLYALLEGFVEALLRYWLGLLPDLVSGYEELPASTRREHTRRIGRLLARLDWTRYAHLSVERTVAGLYNAVRGEPYELLPEAFLIREANLRADGIRETFAICQIPGAWDWVEGHPGVSAVIREERPGQSARSELKRLLDYRNDAAHGRVDEILGTDELRVLCRLLRAICTALKELVDKHHLDGMLDTGSAELLGEVTETFTHDAVVAIVSGRVLNGERLYARGAEFCTTVTIASIQLDGVDVDVAESRAAREVGLMFDRRLRRGTELIRLLDRPETSSTRQASAPRPPKRI